MKEYKVKVYDDRTEWYNLEGELHREDGPAKEYANGDKEYYINGQLHREDGPAVECSNGDKYYYINDKYLTEEEFNNRNNPTLDKAAEYYAHNYFDMHETNSYKELKKGFIAGVEWERKTNTV